jgi:hypothetical protein
VLGGVSTLVLLAASFAFGSSGDVVFALAMVPLPAGVAVAVLRHGMWDVDLVINRSIVYAVLTAVVIGTYVAIVALVTELVARPVAGVVAVALVALAFHPLHARVQRAATATTPPRRCGAWESNSSAPARSTRSCPPRPRRSPARCGSRTSG